ncbi:hypothetical protein [Scrofimicrobium canadense]|uniref:hypothetical protein n=1 Tax=Scrofimicrobium canadense TaxID=2652290 RepID=UPI00197E0A25|nr:hypothetical protein [Scrofimicrobium canadense]
MADRESLAGTPPDPTEAVSPHHFKRQARTQVRRRLVLTGASTLSRGSAWHLLSAGAFISVIVPMAVFLSLQRFFVRGLLAGSVKG